MKPSSVLVRHPWDPHVSVHLTEVSLNTGLFYRKQGKTSLGLTEAAFPLIQGVDLLNMWSAKYSCQYVISNLRSCKSYYLVTGYLLIPAFMSGGGVA